MVKFYLLRFILLQQRKLAFLTKAQVTNQKDTPFLRKALPKIWLVKTFTDRHSYRHRGNTT